ncbi:MAG: AAA family ATPase [Victivallales bacterium]|nr:AAA family ATPase [Victivallales bacterium]
MGIYLNPGNTSFRELVNYEYVDKSGLTAVVNRTIDTPNRLSCVSRPRRFGKSVALQMLAAYYDRTCDSSPLFDNLELAKDPTYREHLNRYNVILLDMAAMSYFARGYDKLPQYLFRQVAAELREQLPAIQVSEGADVGNFCKTLHNAVELSGAKFVMLIDEWDAPIREAKSDTGARDYLEFLRSLFKNSGMTEQIFAAAYMTGILPVRRYGTQSALSNFVEYTILEPEAFAPYVGFLEPEVQALCEKHGLPFSEMKRWYDGYSLPGGLEVYNPNSVMQTVRSRNFRSYWSQTSAADVLIDYISMDFDGLSKTVAGLLAGIEAPVDTVDFRNDLRVYSSRDDILTALTHLGYLTYNSERGTVRIPNEEIRDEFARAVHKVRHPDTIRRVKESEQLFLDTAMGNAEKVAAQIEKVHEEECSPLHYNREASLRSVVKLAYYTYKDNYLQFEELPAGAGYADILYLPKKYSDWPALLIELKWNRGAEGAIAQVKARNYPQALKGYGGPLVLAGISYDKEAPPGQRHHTCVIETVEL